MYRKHIHLSSFIFSFQKRMQPLVDFGNTCNSVIKKYISVVLCTANVHTSSWYVPVFYFLSFSASRGTWSSDHGPGHLPQWHRAFWRAHASPEHSPSHDSSQQCRTTRWEMFTEMMLHIQLLSGQPEAGIRLNHTEKVQVMSMYVHFRFLLLADLSVRPWCGWYSASLCALCFIYCLHQPCELFICTKINLRAMCSVRKIIKHDMVKADEEMDKFLTWSITEKNRACANKIQTILQ